MRLQTYQLIGLFAATAAGSCPYAPDPSTGVCGECPDVRDSQCVVNGNWYSCFQDLETCCDDWSIQGSLGTEHCLAASGGAKVNCDDVVALDASLSNTDCQTQCQSIQGGGADPKNDASFASRCGVETLEVANGHTTSSGTCFNNWIYGYSEPENLAGYAFQDDVISAAHCQSICQEDADCVRFSYTSTSFGQSSSYDRVGRCILKNADQVASPLETVFPGGKGLNSNYCNTQMEYSCKNLYDCLKCNDTTRCVWASDDHLSGWKHCSDQRDSCDPHSDVTTTTPKPTTTTPKPTTTTTKPTTTKPTTTTTKPTTTTTEPTTTTTEPTTTTTKPTTTEPTTTTTKPTTTKPTTTKPTTTKPTTTKPTTTKPTTTKPTTTKPTTTKPTTTKPTTTKPTTTKPTTTKPTTTKPVTTKPATTTTAKPIITTTRPVTVTTTPAADTTTASGGGGNGAKIGAGVASAAGGLALLGGALRYFNRPPAEMDAAFVADEADVPEFEDREAAGAVTEDMYA